MFTLVYLWLVYISPAVPGFPVLWNKRDPFLLCFSPQAKVITFGLRCLFASSLLEKCIRALHTYSSL